MALQEFHSICYMTCDYATFDPANEFGSYPFWEVYNPSGKYQKEDICDFKQGKHKYRFILANITFRDDKEHLQYVYAEEVPHELELKNMAVYCECSNCARPWYQFWGVACPCCIGCLQSARPQQYQINKARNYMKSNGIPIYNHYSTWEK